MFFENCVEVASTEPERTDARSARMTRRTDPRARLSVDVKRRRFAQQRIERLRYFDRRRQHFLMKRHRRFDQPGGAGGRLRMSDLRLYRSQSTPGSFAL